MAPGWVKSLQCKSRDLEDVVHHHRYNHHHHTHPKHHHSLSTSSSNCRSFQNIKDVVDNKKHQKPTKPKPSYAPPNSIKRTGNCSSRKIEPCSELYDQHSTGKARSSSSMRHSCASDAILPALTGLPEGYPSRNVVEIIFHSSWSPDAFSGRIEMVFKVQNMTRTVSRFEEYREIVKSRASSSRSGVRVELDGSCEDHARCVADGNEMMRFYCLGPTHGGAYDTGGCAWMFGGGGKGTIIRTFSGSGVAHEHAGGARGRRAMLVCRVISGRLGDQLGFDVPFEGQLRFDSVSRDDGELLVFDPRAVLPCFLIIYKL